MTGFVVETNRLGAVNNTDFDAELRKLGYIRFGHIKSNSKPNIDDFAPKILGIIFQQRNLG